MRGVPRPLWAEPCPLELFIYFYLFIYFFSIFLSQFHFLEAVRNVHKYNILKIRFVLVNLMEEIGFYGRASSIMPANHRRLPACIYLFLYARVREKALLVLPFLQNTLAIIDVTPVVTWVWQWQEKVYSVFLQSKLHCFICIR